MKWNLEPDIKELAQRKPHPDSVHWFTIDWAAEFPYLKLVKVLYAENAGHPRISVINWRLQELNYLRKAYNRYQEQKAFPGWEKRLEDDLLSASLPRVSSYALYEDSPGGILTSEEIDTILIYNRMILHKVLAGDKRLWDRIPSQHRPYPVFVREPELLPVAQKYQKELGIESSLLKFVAEKNHVGVDKHGRYIQTKPMLPEKELPDTADVPGSEGPPVNNAPTKPRNAPKTADQGSTAVVGQVFHRSLPWLSQKPSEASGLLNPASFSLLPSAAAERRPVQTATT